MPVIFALVAQLPSKVLVEHFDGTYASCAPGVLEQTARSVLGKVNPQTEPRMSFTHENHMIHTIAEKGCIFLCVTDIHCQKQIAFGFLDGLTRRFNDMFPQSSRIPEA